MIYRIMERIIDQSIPSQVINKGNYNWNPYTNEIFENGEKININSEETGRYEVFIKNFQAVRQLDPYSPHYKTQLDRSFDGTMEILQKDVEDLFIGLVSSQQVKEVAALIKLRLGRELEPFDIWYNGFSAGKNVSEMHLQILHLLNTLMLLHWKPICQIY